MNRTLFATALLVVLALNAQAQTTDQNKPRVNVSGSITANTTWTASNVYVLNGFVYVENGATLTIQPGTVVKARAGTGANASALVITRGAKIDARGRGSAPIVFTAASDSVAVPDISRANGGLDGVDYRESRSLWGGVVLLGRASNNVGANVLVEGLPNVPQAYYGPGTGNLPVEDDNSGVMRYVSIKYSGSVIEANRELQSLTLAGVGSGTTIEYIESFNSGDDGFEFFGGTVNTRYLISAFADDDAFDYDEGFRGKHQFWFAIQAAGNGDKLGEFDSGNTTPGITATPLADPNIYNATFIGRGLPTPGGVSPNDGLIFKEYGGGGVFNSIITDVRGYAVQVNADTKPRFTMGGIRFTHNIIGTTGRGLSSDADVAAAFGASGPNSIRVVDPQLRSIVRTHDAGAKLDPRPAATSPALTGAVMVPNDPFYTQVSFVGAFGPTQNWAAGWTALATNGILTNEGAVGVSEQVLAARGVTLGALYPNPARGAATLAYSLDRAKRVTVTVYDLMGRAVATLADGLTAAGDHIATLDATDLAAGTYVVRLTADGAAATRTVVVAR
jgi:hypothetical protein